MLDMALAAYLDGKDMGHVRQPSVIIERRESIKQQTLEYRRLQNRRLAA
jgi:hypothetical protein